MFDKRKMNFWRLAFVFTGLAVITLFLLWNSPQQPKAQMMDSSMGNMMKQMHVTNITIYDLLGKGDTESQMSGMHSSQQSKSPVMFKLNSLLTGIIFLLLPFIIGGSIVLAIVWMRFDILK